ncbi:uncharacterized protein KY384_006603 [Bacidia gigantensis]|uniref:uncharacterized protein n=1 Tax=Bacidia gigantensis TaxID=2732470 RepID=UPI001D0419E8|nr:uncharacterized protein KY384_006603 [Bacidia gigantensis]KAG8528914.1 hypothetical protein KY384_006603 [Bacidia gigantensis]
MTRPPSDDMLGSGWTVAIGLLSSEGTWNPSSEISHSPFLVAMFTRFLLFLLPLVGAKFAVTPFGALRRPESRQLTKRNVFTDSLASAEAEDLPYTTYNLSVPIDYFHNESKYEPHSSDKFNLRYFFDAQYYKDGGPVIVLQGGETSVTDRIPYLQKGIVSILAKATNGIGVILEHRYYGTSFPTEDLSIENLRFLTTEQALADQAYFAENVKFEGLEDKKLNAPDTPYIAYGGSYAGAFVAFLRLLYPDMYYGRQRTKQDGIELTFSGAIGSSAVTEAIWDFWAYYEPVRKYGPPLCIKNTQLLTNVVDNILLKGDAKTTQTLKSAFGLADIVYDDDFANTLSFGIGGWQGRNWDPDVNSPGFDEYCGNITANSTIYSSNSTLSTTASYLLSAAGYNSTLLTPLLNYIGYINATIPGPAADANETLNQYYTNHNATFYAQDSLADSWRSWPYQYCTQWGYLQTGSGVPSDELPLISRLLTLDYESLICQYAFNLTTPADTEAINKYGGYDLAYDRLAFVDGEIDPWRGVSPHAPQARPRESTTERPFILIADAVHHWDENGLLPNETTPDLPPKPVADAQSQEVEFVKAWLAERNDVSIIKQ